MNRKIALLMIVTLAALALAGCQTTEETAAAAESIPPTQSAYVVLQDTEIRGISAEDIEDYRTGAGLGLALPAELNGYPGPRHTLDLAEELELTAAQEAEVQQLFDGMQFKAIALGEEILVLEEDLELAFREKTIDEAQLEAMLTQLGELHTELRFVHLRTHLAMFDILTEEQIMHYNAIRGYDSMPGGHSPGMSHGDS